MISAVLSFLGATLVYTGYLTSDRDVTLGLSIALLGIVFLIKPAFDALHYYKMHFASRPKPGGPKGRPKAKPRPVHLKVVKSDDDRPTIH